MPNTHCGKHNKLSKTMGVTTGPNGRNNKFTVAYTENRDSSFCLINCFFPCFSILFHQLREETCSLAEIFF